MKKVDWKTLNVTLKTGEISADKEINIDPGERVLVAAAYSGDKTKIVNLSLIEGGQPVVTAMDLDFWKRSNAGPYLDGFRPLSYTGGSQLKARLDAPVALDSDIHVQVVFAIVKESTAC
ncbi:MAG: hypothetical protein WBL21_00080 [Salinimicrobium sp.]